MTHEVEELVAYRLAQAKETLIAGRQLFDGKHYRDAINRAYYAMFYAALGLLAGRQLGTSKHTGALGMFGRYFVKTGEFSSSKAVYLRQAFELRQKCDYREFVNPSADQAEELLNHADEFLHEAHQTWEHICETHKG